jgi:hypothetical protein
MRNPLEERVGPHIRRRAIGAVAALVVGLLTAPATAHASAADPPAVAQAVARALSAQTRIAGTAWLVDPRSHTVVAIADRTVTGGGAYYFVTAGHCGSAATTWTTLTGAVIGSTVNVNFPADDYALVRHTGRVTHEGTVGGQDITSAGTAHVGEHVCMRGGTSGVHCGTVLALNATVDYAQGAVGGLIETSICSEPGDSGAPLYDGTVLLGLLSGGSGNCASGGLPFFQPITEVLSAYGLSVY